MARDGTMKIYLDNSATTQPLPEVVEAMTRTLTHYPGNPSSGHSNGRDARRLLEEARQHVAGFLAVEAEQVVFVSGATEANHAVLRQARENPDLRLISTAGEHPATHGVFANSPERISLVPVDSEGRIDLEALDKELRVDGPALVAIGWVSGETGVVQPVNEICDLARARGKRTLIDGAQATGRLPRREFVVPCDYLTVSAHKMGGPQGVGALVLRPEIRCPGMAVGGGQEAGCRSGTENLPGIAGFGAACERRGRNPESDLRRIEAMRDRLEKTLRESGLPVRINGGGTRRVPTNTNVMFEHVDGMALVARCDAAGVVFSQVSACSTGLPRPSRALTAMGLSEKAAYSSVRLSLSVQNREEDIDKAAGVILREARKLMCFFGSCA